MNRGLIKNYQSADDIAPYLMVQIIGNKEIALATDKTKPIIGVTSASGAKDGRADVTHTGIAPVIASGAIEAGKPVTCDNAGKAVVATATDYTFGISLNEAKADGDHIEILITHGGD